MDLGYQISASRCMLSFMFVIITAPLFGYSGGDDVIVRQKSALLVVNVQDCFLEEGPLRAQHAEGIMPVINHVREEYDSQFTLVILVQDWHCPDDVSFASQHPGKGVFDVVTLKYNKKGKLCRDRNLMLPYAVRCRKPKYTVQQILWPDHCVAGSRAANFPINLLTQPTDLVMKKGNFCQIDTMSAFEYKGGFVGTGLHEILVDNGITVVFLMGLVLEYSIYHTAIAAVERNYTTYMVIDAVGNVDIWKTEPILHELFKEGVRVIAASDIPVIFKNLGYVLTSTAMQNQAGVSLIIITCAISWSISTTGVRLRHKIT